MKFWGTRGSIAVPGQSTVRIGGNTPCVEVRCGHSRIVFDAGTGIRSLGLEMSRDNVRTLDLFLTHYHLDHLQGFPFFLPVYDPECTVRLHMPRHSSPSATGPLEALMNQDVFPVPFSKLPANILSIPVNGDCKIGEAVVKNKAVNHPGGCIAYRVEHGGEAMVYLTDHEPYRSTDPDSPAAREKDEEVLEFMKGATLVVREAQYAVDEYPRHRGWGHGTFDDALGDAISAGTKKLAIFHHDPEHDDRYLESQLARLTGLAPEGLEVMLAREGQTIELGG